MLEHQFIVIMMGTLKDLQKAMEILTLQNIKEQLLMSCLQNEIILESLYEQVLEEDPELSELKTIRLTEELFEDLSTMKTLILTDQEFNKLYEVFEPTYIALKG